MTDDDYVCSIVWIQGASKSNWRQKHEDFIKAIRYAKQASQYEKSGRIISSSDDRRQTI